MQSRVAAGTFEPEAYKRQSKTAFSVFWKQFCRRYKGRNATLDKLNSVYKHLAPFHQKQMRDIKAHMVDDWWVGLNLSPRYKNDILVWLKTFFKYAHGLDIIEKVPYPMPKAINIQRDEIDFLTEDEQLSILRHIPDYDRQIFDFLFLTGVRVNESCGLYRADVDWDRGVVWIKRTVKRDGSIGPVKNKKLRPIPLASVRHCFTSGKVVKISQYQFTNKWGRRYSDDYLRDTFKAACIAAGVKPILLKNATRHSFGMGLLRKGYDIWQASKALNHSTIRMTENYLEMLGGEVAGMYGRGIKDKIDKKVSNNNS